MTTSVMEPPKGMVSEGTICGIGVGDVHLCPRDRKTVWTIVGLHRLGCGTMTLVARNTQGIHVPFHPVYFQPQSRHH